jgi:iron complex outermembrane receptor protein
MGSPVQLAVFALIAGANAAHAQAQAPAPAQAAASAAAAPAASASAPAPATLSEVIVTATKRSTSLQRTPLAVTAIGEAELEKARVQTVMDIVHLVPSFQATTQGDHGVITMTLRGVGNDSAKTEYADPEVATFIDGVYAPRPEGAAQLLFDLESVEVLRGPQGTLWGRNSTVGAINMQTIKPVLGEQSGSIQGGLGNYNQMGARAAFNFPLGDTLAMRIALAHEQHDGYTSYQAAPRPSLTSQQAAAAPVIAAYNLANPTNPIAFQPINQNLFVQGGDKYNAQDMSAARISLLWKPSAALSWNVSYEQFMDRGTPSMNLMQTPRAGQEFWSALIQVAPSLIRDVSTLRSRLDYTVNEGLSAYWVAGLSKSKGSADYDQAGGASVPTSFTTGATYQQDRTNHFNYSNQSQEVALYSTGKNTVDWLLGLYYASEDNSIRFDIPIMNGTQQGTVGWQGSFIQPEETVKSGAIFGQATWNVSDAFHLTGGLRYTKDRKANVGGTNNGWTYDPTVPQVPVDPGSSPGTPGSGFSTYQNNDGTYSSGKVTYLARASYDFSQAMMGYVSVANGYKSGGLQDGGIPFGSETLTSFEIGTKNKFADGAVTFNNALYYQDFKDFQFSAPVTFPNGTRGLATSNAEGATVWGLESELAAKLTSNDRVLVALAFTKTKLGQLIAGSNDYALPPCTVPGISTCLDVTGNQLPHAPKFTANVQYEHVFRLDGGSSLTPRINFHYETASWLSVFNLGDGDQQAAYSRADLSMRYAASKNWYVDAFVQNAGNGKVKTNAQNSFGVWQSQYMPPRTYGVSAGMTF